MSESLEQLSFHLAPAEPYSLAYFISHRGVAEAAVLTEQFVAECLADAKAFRMLHLFGPAGSGKTHLAQGSRLIALSKGLAKEKILTLEWEEIYQQENCIIDSSASSFVSAYEAFKREGGLILSCSRKAPTELLDDPHVKSRLLSGSVLEMFYPTEDEISPILASLSARHNLKLSEKSLNYLVQRLPLEPLSFDNIFARISELSLSEGKAAGFSIVKRMFSRM